MDRSAARPAASDASGFAAILGIPNRQIKQVVSPEVASQHSRAALLLLTAVFVAVAAGFQARSIRQWPAGPIDATRIEQVQTGIDPNAADWADLASLPGIGPALAQRIVEYRETTRRMDGARLVFKRPADLDAVRGIGQKKIQQMSPFLRFPTADPWTKPLS